MDHLKYPIGQFMPAADPTQAQREAWIEDIAKLPTEIRKAVSNLTEDQLHTPYRPDGWTIQQVIHHVADNDMNAYLRFKRALTEEHPTASSYREDLWAELSDYQNTPIETSLILIESLHNRFVILLRTLQPEDFQRTFKSPILVDLTLDVAAQRYAWHNRHHLAQITSLRERMGW